MQLKIKLFDRDAPYRCHDGGDRARIRSSLHFGAGQFWCGNLGEYDVRTEIRGF